LAKFLIIRLSSIGDIVLTTPVVRCLKNQIEDSEIHYVTKSENIEILKHNPFIDKIHTFDGNLKSTINNLQSEGFDFIIDLHNNFRSSRIKNELKVFHFTLNKLNFKKWLLVNFKINKLPKIHIVDRYLQTLKAFGVKNDNLGLDYFISENDKVNLPIEFQNGFVAIVVGAKHFTKQIPSEKIIEICEKIDFPIVLLGGKSDTEKSQKISDFLVDYNTNKGKNLHIFDACGKFTINQSASIIQQSKLIITADTGLMHIAAALKKTIISVWGNTVPDFGMYPYLPAENSIIIENKNLKCRSCSKIGFDKCPKKHFKCMMEIDVEEIVKIVTLHL
jgi:ADP-heptose:LPS heptosyltransferase